MSLGIMLLPAEGQFTDNIPDAHCTLVYAGELDDEPAIRSLRLTWIAARLAAEYGPVRALVVGFDLFGKNSDEPVVLLNSITLEVMNRWCNTESRSEFTEFKPHIATHGRTGWEGAVTFDRVAVWLGNRTKQTSRRITWQLGTGDCISDETLPQLNMTAP